MEFKDLLDFPNQTNLKVKPSNYKKENHKAEIKQGKFKSDISKDDFFYRILKKVKLSVNNSINIEEVKNMYKYFYKEQIIL